MRVHLHDEQFDDHLHAACHRVRHEETAKIVGDHEFQHTPIADRCRYCSVLYFPFGEPVS